MMVSQDLTVADVESPEKEVSFPDSVVSMLKGDLGQSPGGAFNSLFYDTNGDGRVDSDAIRYVPGVFSAQGEGREC